MYIYFDKNKEFNPDFVFLCEELRKNINKLYKTIESDTFHNFILSA